MGNASLSDHDIEAVRDSHAIFGAVRREKFQEWMPIARVDLIVVPFGKLVVIRATDNELTHCVFTEGASHVGTATGVRGKENLSGPRIQRSDRTCHEKNHR